MRPKVLGVACFLVFAVQARIEAQEVFTNFGASRTEALLRNMNIDFKKVDGKKEGVYYYDFTRNNFKVRLHNYEGKDLWIDAVFTDRTTPDELNRWNRQAKFSRAVLVKSNDRDFISLENQIDCLGGVTDNIIRQFITRFDGEVKNFVGFLTK